MGTSGKGVGHTVEPVGYEPNPNAALKPCRAATSLSVVDKNVKFQAAAHAEEVQHGTHGKEERAETADQMLGRLLEEMDTPCKEHGERTGTRSSDSTRRSLMEKEVGESVMALTGAGEVEP